VKMVTGAAVLLMVYTNLTTTLADTIEAALVRAYQNNPQLNAQRATVRATDENVPQALSGCIADLQPVFTAKQELPRKG
jgi:outer membrane protein